MTAKSKSRGHEITYDEDLDIWTWDDDGQPLDNERPCARCARPPTPEGHDACVGSIPGVSSACCGHGVESPAVFLEEQSPDFNWRQIATRALKNVDKIVELYETANPLGFLTAPALICQTRIDVSALSIAISAGHPECELILVEMKKINAKMEGE